MIRLFFVLIYATAAIVVYRRLFPSLGVGAKLVAAFILLAQTLAIAIALGYQPRTDFESWLWDLDGEQNITAALAATQLACVAWAALAGAWLSRRPLWYRLYLLGLCLLYFFLSFDEFAQFHDSVIRWEVFYWWELFYVGLGAVVGLFTLVAALRSPPGERKWHICLLTGLALGAFGALVVEQLHEPAVCALFDETAPGGCRWHFYLEESMEFLGMWLALVAALGHFTVAASTIPRRFRLAFSALVAFVTLIFWANTVFPRLAIGSTRAGYTAIEIVLWSIELAYPIIFLLYVLVGAIGFQWLIPRLKGAAAHVASGVFVALAVTVALAFGFETDSAFDKWLWDMGQEYNIHSLLSSAQLALVGFVALFCAWCADARLSVFRLYLVAIGLIFLFLAYDEYAVIHENIQHWERYYLMLGMAVVAATLYTAARSPRRQRLWHGCFLVGLAMSAVGIVLYDLPRQICAGESFLPLRRCLWTYNYEEPLELLGIWLALIAMLGLLSEAGPTLRRRLVLALLALPALWIALLLHSAIIPRLDLRFTAKSSAIRFDSGVALLGYRIDQGEDKIAIDIYPSALQRHYRDLGISAHLVDQAKGSSLAKTDEHTDYQKGWLFAPGQPHIYRQRIVLDIPPDAPTNRAMWVTLSAWREVGGEYLTQHVVESDLPRLGDHHVILDEMVLLAPTTATESEPLARIENGFALQGVDMPESGEAGDVLPVTFAWRSEVDGQGDYSQFLHLGHVASGEWFVYDQPPLGDRLPTRLWYKGMSDRETWHVPLPSDLPSGRYAVFTGLYRAQDQLRLSLTAADGHAPPDSRLQLGSLVIDSRSR